MAVPQRLDMMIDYWRIEWLPYLTLEEAMGLNRHAVRSSLEWTLLLYPYLEYLVSYKQGRSIYLKALEYQKVEYSNAYLLV